MVELLICLIPALPLLAAILLTCLGKKTLGEQGHWLALAGTGGACACSLMLLLAVQNMAPGAVGKERIVKLWTWSEFETAEVGPGENVVDDNAAASGDSEIVARQQKLSGNRGLASSAVDVVLRVDPLTSIMLVMVTFVASLVIYYASGYMHGDPGYNRFFVFVSLFVFSMTMLVSVSNFLLLYMFWEAVGACSYLLIGFWFRKPEAAAASKKAFLVNRIGDFGFALGIFLLWTTYGTLNFHDTPAGAGILGQSRLADPTQFVGGTLGTAIILLLFVGACGKSAQFPLHVWLPDAMEGPTPVSALIHAATMVTAGVYMVTRCAPLLVISPFAQATVAVIGGITALLAGVIAVTQTDLKRVLAYSTISQLGFMFLSLGTGSPLGFTAGMFHLFTHAFFKALLFLGAGSVMHAMGGVIDFKRFGGLRQLMPMTNATFLIGCLALAGIPPLSGFFSKDEILLAVYERAFPSQSAAAVPHAATGSVLPTDTRDESQERRVFRLARLSPHVDAASAHPVEAASEPGAPATAEHASGDHGALSQSLQQQRWLYQWLYFVALFSAFLTAYYTTRAYCQTFWGDLQVPPEAGDHAHESPPNMVLPLLILSIFAVLVGLILAKTGAFAGLLEQTPSLKAIAHEGGHHAVNQAVVLQGTTAALAGLIFAAFFYLGETSEIEAITRRMLPVYNFSKNQAYLDRIYQILFVVPLQGLATLCGWVDRRAIDQTVDVVGALPGSVGWYLRLLQPGLVQFYALGMALGALILLGCLFRFGG